jgi:hypothetical protein
VDPRAGLDATAHVRNEAQVLHANTLIRRSYLRLADPYKMFSVTLCNRTASTCVAFLSMAHYILVRTVAKVVFLSLFQWLYGGEKTDVT